MSHPDILTRAKNCHQLQDFSQAINLLLPYISNSTDSNKSIEAYYYLGISYLKLKDFISAHRYLDLFYQRIIDISLRDHWRKQILSLLPAHNKSTHLISFCLWGDNPKYTYGALENALLIPRIYPQFQARFYLGQSVPSDIVFQLQMLHAQVIIMPEAGNWQGMLWRFLAIDEPEVDVMLSRDCDSLVSVREASAVQEWLDSDKKFHIMRDHPHHGAPILGGMWGIKKTCFAPNTITELIKFFESEDKWQTDQIFLRKKVYPLVKDKVMVHDEYFKLEGENAMPFPIPRENKDDFIGKPYERANV